MSYDHPRDRLELRLKEIVDDTTPAADRRTRFESFLTGIVSSGLTPATARDRLELYLTELSGRAAGGTTPTGTINISANGTYDVTDYASASVSVPGANTLAVDSRKITGIPHSMAVTLGWQPQKIVVSYTWRDPDYTPPGDEDHPVAMVTYEVELSASGDITGEGDDVTITSTGYTLNFNGTGFNDNPGDYSDFVIVAAALT